MIRKLIEAVGEELNVDTYPDLIEESGVDLASGKVLITGTDGLMYQITVVEVAVDDAGRVGVVDGPRCEFCIKHGVASCSHMGM
jgi:hypothetical protein